MKFLIVIVLSSILQLSTFAQEVGNLYYPKNPEHFKDYFERITTRQVERYTGEHAPKIKKVYKNRPEELFESVEDSTYFFDKRIIKNLGSLLSKIYKANPSIDTLDYHFFTKNSPVPNAGCYGDGMFEVNIGLYNLYEYDDELAMVLCHEIAHKLLDHSFLRIQKGANELYSEETKQKIRDIKKMKYGRTRAGMSLVNELNINLLNHTREAEATADSLGYILYKNSGFAPKAALSALKKLDHVDDEIFNHPVQLDSLLDFAAYPFKKYWLEEEISLFESDERLNDFNYESDTLKTHPDIPYRIEKLTTDFGVLREGNTSDQYITRIQESSIPHDIQLALDKNRYDLVIYHLKRQFDTGIIEGATFYTSMANVLKCIYEAKDNHELGKNIPQVNKLSDEAELNIIRQFLFSIELKELKKLGAAFCNAHAEKTNNSKEFIIISNHFNNP